MAAASVMLGPCGHDAPASIWCSGGCLPYPHTRNLIMHTILFCYSRWQIQQGSLAQLTALKWMLHNLTNNDMLSCPSLHANKVLGSHHTLKTLTQPWLLQVVGSAGPGSWALWGYMTLAQVYKAIITGLCFTSVFICISNSAPNAKKVLRQPIRP